MNYEQFAIWLHGFLEISNAEEINKEQTQIIKDHLALLFEKKTPDRSKNKDADVFEEFKKREVENWKKRNPKPPYCVPPTYVPIPAPAYPGFDPYKITCDQGTGAPLQQLPTSVCSNEIALGEQFKGVDLNIKFDTELHKEKKYC